MPEVSAQSAFNSLWDASDLQFDENISRKPDGIADQVGAGVDLGQALLYRGGQSIAESFGFADSAFGQAMVEGKNENIREVEAVTAHPLYDEDGEFSFRGLADQVARGAGTVGVALPALLVAPVAPVVGVSGTAGALVASGVTSGLMNIGDIGLKAEDMDEAYTASLADVGTGLALGALEPLAAARFVKAMSPAIKNMSPEVLKALDAGKTDLAVKYIREGAGRGVGLGRNVGTAMLTSGVTEAVQDFSTTIAASNATNYWDELDIQEAMKESAIEGLVGGILGLPFGVGGSIMTKAQNGADMSVAKQIEEGILEYNPDADVKWSKNYEKIPVTETKAAHLYNRLLAPILGDKPAQFAGRLNTPKARKLAAKFQQTTGDFGRRIGIVPVHFNTMQYKSEYNKGLRSFMELSKAEAQAVHDHRVMPEDSKENKALKNEAYANFNKQQKESSNQLATFLDLTIKNDLKALDIDTTLYEGGTYFPLLGRLDYKKIKTNRAEFIEQAVAEAEANGLDLSRDKIEAYVGRIEEQGFEHFGNETDVNVVDTFKEDVEAKSKEIQEKEGLSQEDAYKKAMKAVAKGKQGRVGSTLTSGAKVNKQNAVETHRMLAELPQDFWNNWVDPKTSVQEAVYSYYEMMSERLGHAKTFGSEGELFYEELYDVIADAKAQGKRFDAKAALNEMADAMNLSQRIPKRNLDTSRGTAIRTAQNAVRAGLSVTLLPLSILPSLAEVFVVASRTGQTGKTVSTAGKLTAQIIKEQFKHGRGLPFKDASKLVDEGILEDLGISLYELKNTAAARIGDNEIGGKITNVENFFYNLTLTPQFTEALRMTAAIMAEQTFRSDLALYSDAVASGNLEEQLRISDKFAEAGLNMNETYNWHRRGGKKDKFYREQFRMGVLNIVEDTVMRPRMVQKPAWMADERFKLLGQLKSFSIVFNNVVMKGWYNQMVANGTSQDKLKQAAVIAPYIGMMLATQVMASALREFAKTGDIEKWEDKNAMEHALSAVTYIGGLSFAVDPLRASNWGVDPTTVLLGPAASKFNDTMGGVTAIMSGSIAPEDVIMEVLRDVGKSFPIIPALLEE
jgi:hypothetical protein